MAGQDAAITRNRGAIWSYPFGVAPRKFSPGRTARALRALRNDRHSSLHSGTRASFRRLIAPLRARSRQTRVLFGWLHACELCSPRMANVERTHLEFMCDGGTREDRNANREKSASVAGRNDHIYCDDIAPPQRGADAGRGILLRLDALHPHHETPARERFDILSAQAPERSSAPR